jgi:hypothetical protein
MGKMHEIHMNQSSDTPEKLDEKWFTDVHIHRPGQSRNEDLRYFCTVISRATRTKDRRAIKLLFDTLTDADCGGALESVYGVLGSVDINDYYSVLVENLASMIERAPNSAAQCLDFPGRELTWDEQNQVSQLVINRCSRGAVEILISTMLRNGMSDSDNHKTIFNNLLKAINK